MQTCTKNLNRVLADLSGSKMFVRDQRTDGLSDAQNIVKNLIENIVSEVIKSISVRTSYCFKSLEPLDLEMCANEEISDCFGMKNAGIEKHMCSNSLETISLIPNMSDMFHQDTAKSAELCSHTPSLSTSSKHGEGDYLGPKIRETAASYHSGIYSNQSYQHLKNVSNSSLNTESSHDELIENLNHSIYNFSFDNIHWSESETEDGIDETVLKPYLHVPEKSSVLIESQYSLPNNKESDNFINSLNMLQNSKKMCQSNNTLFSSMEPTNYNNLEINDCETCESETKISENEPIILPGSTEEVIVVDNEVESLNSEKFYCETNPFKNSSQCTRDPLISSISSYCYLDPDKNPGKESKKINVFADIEPLNNITNWEEAFEKQVNITDLEVASKTEDIEEDFTTKNRKYWSNIGLISEDKINSRYVGPTDSLGIESIKGMTTVEKHFLTSGNERPYLVNKTLLSGNKNQSAHSNHCCNYEEKVNSLSCSGKREEQKKKKFISRFRKTISNLFKLKNKNEDHK